MFNSQNTTVITRRQLGHNCWLVRRFIRGSRCERVLVCQYPEKKTCRAILAEVDYLSTELDDIHERSKQKIREIAELISLLLNDRR